MPTTTIVPVATSTASLQSKTNEAGAAVLDVNGEELRLYAGTMTPGVVQPDAWQVVPAAPGLAVQVGTTVQKNDLAVVEGTGVGQGRYLVRLDGASPFGIALAAADLTNPRIDEVYLVVSDNAYDSGGRTLGRLAIRKGDPSGSPVAPGPDSAWKAFLHLATVSVPAGATTVSTGDILDLRVPTRSLIASDSYTKTETDALLAGKVSSPLPNASTTVKGIVQLSTSVSSTSTALAATASAVKAAYDEANHSHPYASSGHNHSGDYAPPHSHPYAASSHSHSAYSPTSHGHSGYVAVGGDTMTGGLVINNGGLAVELQATFNGRVIGPGTDTTSDTGLPSWRVVSSSTLARLVSSLRYKRAVKPVDVDLLLDQVRTAASKLISYEEKGSPKDSPRIFGLSAEDAYEILPTSVALDDEGRPDSVDVGNAFSVHLIAAVGNLLDRVEVLEGAAVG